MGYYSSFEVIDTDIPDILDVLSAFEEKYEWGSPGWRLNYNGDAHSYDSGKWYDWIADLNDLAVQYPENFLVIERCGEESPDISRAVVKHGRVVEIEPELVWPEVD